MIGPRAVARLLRPGAPMLALYTLTALARSALTVAGVLLVREFLAAGMEGGASVPVVGRLDAGAAVTVIAVLLLASHLGAAACNYVSLVTEQRLVRRVELHLMERVLRHLLSLSAGFFDRHSHGDLVQSIRRDVARVRMLALATIGLGLEAVMTVGLLASAWWLSGMTLVVVAVFLLAALPVYLLARRTLEQSRRLRTTSSALYDTVLQLLRGARLIKVYRGVDAEAGRAVARAREHFDRHVEMADLRARAQATLDSFAGLTLVLVIVVGGLQVTAGRLDWPSLVAFLAAITALHKPLGNLGTKLVAVQEHDASYRRIQELLRQRPDVPEASDPVPLPDGPLTLRLEGVSFSYGEAPVLRDLDLVVPPGQALAIVGPSGAGKTTLLGLLARFHDPGSGSVRLGGVDLRRVRLRQLHASLAIVTQEPLLFSTTIAENIRCGRPDATDEEVRQAARAVAVHEEIVALPDGYDTEVGIGTRRLSAGQEQRVCIARALLRDARLLLLDEATSNLDTISEERVLDTLRARSPDSTAIVVTHRPATLRHVDRILVLGDGRVEALGTHAELLRDCALYRRLMGAAGDASPAVAGDAASLEAGDAALGDADAAGPLAAVPLLKP